MLHGESIARLREWEERFPVLSWRLGDLDLWPLLRIQLASDLLAAGRPARPAAGLGSLAGSARGLARSMGSGAGTGAAVAATPHDVVCLGRPANRQRHGGVWHERFFDPITDLVEAGGRTCLHLEHRSRGSDYRLPRQRPALAVTGPVERRIAWARLTARPAPVLDGFDQFAREVSARVPHSPVSRWWLGRRARAVELVARWFGRLFRRVSPRLAFCTVYYSVVGSACCLAARRLGIPAVDVQHGVTQGNPAYDGWSCFPAGGYATLPAWFWAWSESDAAPVRAWPASARPAHRAVVGGQPQMALWQSPSGPHEAGRAALPARSDGGLTVLVTLSWSSGLSDLLRRVIRHSPPSWRWWVRLHPLMERERAAIAAWCARQAPGQAAVEGPSDLPLPLLLQAADVHLTHNSTVVQEAARLGCPSVVIDSRALDVYVEELRSGWAVYAAEPDAIVEGARAQAARRAGLTRPAAFPTWEQMAGTLEALLARDA